MSPSSSNPPSFTIYSSPPHLPHLPQLSPSLPILKIPLSDARKFSTKPLKWVFFAVGVVFGAYAGKLYHRVKTSGCKAGDETRDVELEAVDLDDPNPGPCDLVFRCSSDFDFEESGMAFVDPQVLRQAPANDSESSCESNASASASADDAYGYAYGTFRERILARDKRCVILRMQDACDACYIIPRAKGDHVLSTIRDAGVETPPMEGIDDIRNGVLFNKVTGSLFEGGCMAVMKTPNFALAPDEVLPSPLPHPGQTGLGNPSQAVRKRFTPHYWTEGIPEPFHNDLSYPDDSMSAQWPPDFIWHTHYAGVILQRYGQPDFKRAVGDVMSPLYYPRVDPGASERRPKKTEARERQTSLRERALSRGVSLDTWDMLQNISTSHALALVDDPGVSERARMERERCARFEEEEREERWKRDERVRGWLGCVSEDSPR